ncbi:uncharacterized protein LOC141702313 [Apium graveolens]|uniref:uncharacterized protein LOC141702313 n=1 Tax=Apium graveolens TaxID=4045 RepID=UPI003D7AF2E5
MCTEDNWDVQQSKAVAHPTRRRPSVPENEVGNIGGGPNLTWMTPILAYIKDGLLSDGKNEARRMRYKASRYVPHGSPHIPYESLALLHVGNRFDWRDAQNKGGGVKYAVIAVDYFMKWAEAEPLATITAKKLKEYVHRAIVCRYGIPYKLVSDQGKQFDIKEIREFCEQLWIQKSFSAVSHPKSNGQIEAVNKIIKHTLKVKLAEKK